MASLISKPGLTSAAALSIPTAWSATWFRGMINNYLTGGDVRNAIAGPGITITGTIASPYATISAGGAGAPFVGPIIIKTTPGGVTVFEVFNSTTGPTIEAYGPNAGGLVDLTPDSDSFTITMTGATGAGTTGTAQWRRIGALVLITLPALTGTSTTTAFTLTGIPAVIQPAFSQVSPVMPFINNGVIIDAVVVMNAASGTWTVDTAVVGGTFNPAGWTAAGNKGTGSVFTIPFILS